jgi:hypothetical protein
MPIKTRRERLDESPERCGLGYRRCIGRHLGAACIWCHAGKSVEEVKAENRQLRERVKKFCLCEVGHDRPYWKCPVHGDVSL